MAVDDGSHLPDQPTVANGDDHMMPGLREICGKAPAIDWRVEDVLRNSIKLAEVARSYSPDLDFPRYGATQCRASP
jgi:hypothetical protein